MLISGRTHAQFAEKGNVFEVDDNEQSLDELT